MDGISLVSSRSRRGRAEASTEYHAWLVRCFGSLAGLEHGSCLFPWRLWLQSGSTVHMEAQDAPPRQFFGSSPSSDALHDALVLAQSPATSRFSTLLRRPWVNGVTLGIYLARPQVRYSEWAEEDQLKSAARFCWWVDTPPRRLASERSEGGARVERGWRQQRHAASPSSAPDGRRAPLARAATTFRRL